MNYRVLQVFLIIFFINGCSTLNPYESAIRYNKYEEIQLDQNILKLSYSGHSNQSMIQAEALFLYQCSVRTLENGFDYFIVNDLQKEIKIRRTIVSQASQGSFSSTTQIQNTQPSVISRGSGSRKVVVLPSPSFANTQGTYTSPKTTYQEVVHESPRITALIKMFKGKKSDELSDAYDAKQLSKYLGERINKRKESKN